MQATRIGHLSDVHVPAPGSMRIRDAFSKRLTGWLNFKLKREKEYDVEVLKKAVDRLIEANVDLVVISGDLSNLSFRAEYERAFAILSKFTSANVPWVVIPGNHDRYLPSSDDGTFEEIFEAHLGEPLDGGERWPRLHKLNGITIVGLNSAVPTPPFQAWGRVGEHQIAAVERAIPAILERGVPVLVAVHHHIGKAPNKAKDHERNLKDSDAVVALTEKLGAKLLIHGHNHFLDVRDVGAFRAFAASSGISNQSGFHRSAGQAAIHTVYPDSAPTHEVCFWEGASFSEWRAIEPSTDVPRSAKALQDLKAASKRLT